MSEKHLNKKSSGNRTGMALLGTLVIWLFLLVQQIMEKNSMFMIIAVTIGVWTAGILIAKPGDFAVKVGEVGFWKALFGGGSNQGGRRRRRRR